MIFLFFKNFEKTVIVLLLSFFIIPISALAYSDKVIVGGENIGITLNSDGVLIVGVYDELESKKKAWYEVVNLLFNECFIATGTISNPTSYRTPDDAGWNSLSIVQQKEFTSKTSYIDKLNSYLDYMSFDIRDNSLTKSRCKGIIRQCNDAIAERKREI